MKLKQIVIFMLTWLHCHLFKILNEVSTLPRSLNYGKLRVNIINLDKIQRYGTQNLKIAWFKYILCKDGFYKWKRLTKWIELQKGLIRGPEKPSIITASWTMGVGIGVLNPWLSQRSGWKNQYQGSKLLKNMGLTSRKIKCKWTKGLSPGMGFRAGSEAFYHLSYSFKFCSSIALIKLFIEIGYWTKLWMSSPDMASIGIA